MSQEMVVPALTIPQDDLADRSQSRSSGMQANRTISGRTASTLANNNGSSISEFTRDFESRVR